MDFTGQICSIYFFEPSSTFSDCSDSNKQMWPIRTLHLATNVLIAQKASGTYGHSRTILFYLRHTATRCSAVLTSLWNDFSASSDAVPTRAQTAPLTSWNIYESGRDTASAPGSNHEILSAAATISFSFCSGLEKPGCRLQFVLCPAPPPQKYIFWGKLLIWCIYFLHDNFLNFRSLFATRSVCNALKSQSVQSEQQAAPTLNKTLKKEMYWALCADRCLNMVIFI